VLDARKGEVYCSLYRWQGDAARREWDYAALAPEALAARLGEPVILLGDGAHLVPSAHARLAPPHRRVPSPGAVGVLGLGRLAAGESVDAAALAPIYLRPSEAELKHRGHAIH
jgi:tRNA threonylcarbamoyladenosine biosynthesis protein TsaB